jgi:hypothetical protein
MNLSSIERLPHGETPQNVPALLLTERCSVLLGALIDSSN